MAKIYPERIPEYVKSDPKRSAEIKVYQALSQLPDPYVVFYSVGWQIRTTHSGVQDGESDFVIAHPALGVMILEVKGGQIQYDAKLKQWFSVDRAGVEHAIKVILGDGVCSFSALLPDRCGDWSSRKIAG